MKAFTLKVFGETKELHLFEGEITEKGCTSGAASICGMMKKPDSLGNAFQCLKENEARLECAKMGRKVCGVCVSHLYTTYR